jgi:hypothetical protein
MVCSLPQNLGTKAMHARCMPGVHPGINLGVHSEGKFLRPMFTQQSIAAAAPSEPRLNAPLVEPWLALHHQLDCFQGSQVSGCIKSTHDHDRNVLLVYLTTLSRTIAAAAAAATARPPGRPTAKLNFPSTSAFLSCS